MERVTPWETVERLRLELVCRAISLREIERRLGRSIRHKFASGKEEQVTYKDLLDTLEAAEIEAQAFFARLFGIGNPLSFDLLRPAEKLKWSKGKQKILQSLEGLTAAGSRGFEEFRGELLRIETLRENSPRQAEAAAWKVLARTSQPGAVVGLLAVIALGSKRAKAYHLLTLASEILGHHLISAAGGKFSTVVGRYYTKAGFPRDAITVLRTQALPLVLLFGTADEQARTYFHIAQAAGMVGLDELHVAALKRAAAVGGDSIRFAATQLLAFQELNVGSIELAATMYDEVVGLPYFEKAGRRARAYINWSRLAAHFAAGRLRPDDQATFEAAIEETKEVLEIRDQVAATLDLVLYLKSIGKVAEAQQYLEGELWNALELEDIDVQQKYIGLWERIGLPDDARLATLVNRQGPKRLQSRPKLKFPGQD